jgi:hypothetical protein
MGLFASNCPFWQTSGEGALILITRSYEIDLTRNLHLGEDGSGSMIGFFRYVQDVPIERALEYLHHYLNMWEPLLSFERERESLEGVFRDPGAYRALLARRV